MRSALLAVLVSAPVLGASPAHQVEQLAPGVYVIEHPDALPDFPEGNTTVVIGDRSVLVVDSGYLPSTARRDIEQIRRWTDWPVRTLVLTHGHTDHTSGNVVYAAPTRGFASSRTVRCGTSWRGTPPGYPELFTQRTAELKRQLETNRAEDGTALTAAQVNAVRDDVRAREAITADLRTMGENPLPDVTFDQGGLSFDLGGRTYYQLAPR